MAKFEIESIGRVEAARQEAIDDDWGGVESAILLDPRGKNRPNRLGSTVCRIVRREGRRLVVAELDALDGTPVVDLKPVMQEFLPREAVRQPASVGELMERSWRRPA